jgi:hypothetical protein
LNVHSVCVGFDDQLSAMSASIVSGLAVPGLKRTRPLNIQCNRPLSGVVAVRCGSSLPASADAMPTASVVFCAIAASAPAASIAASPAAPTVTLNVMKSSQDDLW